MQHTKSMASLWNLITFNLQWGNAQMIFCKMYMHAHYLSGENKTNHKKSQCHMALGFDRGLHSTALLLLTIQPPTDCHSWTSHPLSSLWQGPNQLLRVWDISTRFQPYMCHITKYETMFMLAYSHQQNHTHICIYLLLLHLFSFVTLECSPTSIFWSLS
jgi:hypothetical protein